MKSGLYECWLSQAPGIGLSGAYSLYGWCQGALPVYERTGKEILELFKEKGVQNHRFKPNDFDAYKKKLPMIERYLEKLDKKGIGRIIPPNYPKELRQMPDCPLVLYEKGKMEKERYYIAIVGARRCSSYGEKAAHYLGYELGKMGIGIVSGLAYGIDRAAHEGALKAEGYTVAVMAGGLHSCYPKENQIIYEKINERGAIVTEEPYGKDPKAYMFPKRNRLISGLSKGVIVVEAAKSSGSLITTDFALEQGKDVYAVAGRMMDPKCEGSNQLIRDGAKPIFHIDDILSEFAHFSYNLKKKTEKKEKSLEEKEKMVYSCISYDPVHKETLICNILNRHKDLSETERIETVSGKSFSLDTTDIDLCLTSLEIKGSIVKISGCYYARSEV